MTNGPNITSAAGLRRIQVFALNTSGYPDGDQSGADGYDGINVEGAKGFNFSLPGVQRIQHTGNDRLIAQDYLPPTEGASGTITTAKQNLGLDATLTGTLTENFGETTAGGLGTSAQGSEIDVCVIAYRQALDTTEGNVASRRWQMHMFPVGRVIPRGGSADQGAADENSYDAIPTPTSKYPWGHAFTLVDEGFVTAQYLRFTAENPAMMEKWDGNNSLDTFNLSWTPISAAKTHVEVDGVAASVTSVNTGNKTVTLSAAPGNATEVVAWYETSDDI